MEQERNEEEKARTEYGRWGSAAKTNEAVNVEGSVRKEWGRYREKGVYKEEGFRRHREGSVLNRKRKQDENGGE